MVPIHSLPIQVLRTYDSYDKQRGDFGVGWNVSIANFTVQTNGALGKGGWSAEPSGCTTVLGSSICLSKKFKRLSPHFVTVRWPDGKQEVFDFTPNAGADLYYDASAAFTGRSGSTSKLEVSGDSYIQYMSDGNIYDGDLSGHYDPQTFRLTAKDGTAYTIDKDRGLLGAEDRHGNTLTIDESGVHSSTGKSVEFERDASGRITSISGPTNENLTYDYSAAGDLASVTDARGNTMRFEYDDKHNLEVTKDPQNRPFRTIAYDDDGRMTAITDGAGNRTEIDTNLGAKEQLITSPDGRMNTVTSFDDRGNLTAVHEAFDSTSRTTTYAYDANDNLTQTTDPSDASTRSTFDDRGNETSRTSARGHTANYEYDAADDLVRETRPDGTFTIYGRDEFGSPVSIDRGGGRVTELTYDDDGQVTQIEDPLDRVINFAYDSAGDLVSQVDSAGSSSATYDASGRVSSRTDAVGATTQFEYDGDGNLIQVTDENGGETHYSYDHLGRLTSETDQLGAVTSYSYDAAGRLISRLDRNGQTTSFSYDESSRLTAKTVPGAGVTTVGYDGAGRPTAMANADSELTYGYDQLDRVTATNQLPVAGSPQPSVSFAYGYDASGNRTSMSQGGITTSYAYDSLDRLSSLTDSVAGTFGYQRDSLGRMQSMSRPNGVASTFTWDASDQLSQIRHTRASTPLDSANYVYDSAGRRTQYTDSAGLHQYSYDAASQLTAADNPGAQPDEAYTYDPLGNRISGGHGGQVYNAANRLISDNKILYAYDGEGNLTAKTDKVLMLATTYTYDAEHRLRSVTKPGGQTTSYKYDPLGRRIEVAGPSETKRYAYGLDQNMAAEYDENNNRLASFTFGLGMDTPLAMRRGSTSSYYLQDALGSVTSLTNQSGAVTQRYEYGSFGQPLTTGDSTGNPFTYTGREWDEGQGAYHYRARSYDAGAGVFAGEDPVPAANLYRYAGSNPVSYRDPTGNTTQVDLEVTEEIQGSLQKILTASQSRVQESISVYRFIDANTRQVYIGITNNLARRAAQHGARVSEGSLKELVSGLQSRTLARAMEQAFIRRGGGVPNLANKINAMAKSPKKDELVNLVDDAVGKMFSNADDLVRAAPYP